MRTILLLALCVACGGPSDTDDTGTPAPTVDSTAPTADSGTPPPDCLAQWSDGLTDIDPSGPDTQIHATSVFDGEQVWVAWNRPDDASYFDLWLARVDCSGAVTLGPIEVSQSADSELDPVLAMADDRLLVAWSSDNGIGPDNLDIRYRVYDGAGQPIGDARDLDASRNAAPVTGNATLPAVLGTPTGFFLAGSWGHDDSPAFQSFVVELDRDGNVVGEAIDGEVDDVNGQLYVALASVDGTPHLAWQEDSATSTVPTVRGGTIGSIVEVASPGARPDLSVTSDESVWLAYDNDDGVVVVHTPNGAITRLEEGSFQHSPSIIATDDGAVLLTMELVSGVNNRIHLYTLDADGSLLSDHLLATDSAISVYGTDLTLIDDTHAVVAYQDGVNPAFRAKLEWVTLP